MGYCCFVTKIATVLRNKCAASAENKFLSLKIKNQSQRKIKKHHLNQLLGQAPRDFDLIRCKANVTKCTLHDFRRSGITNWAKELPIQVVQTLAGHSNITTTRKYYLAVRPEDFAAASETLKRLLSESTAN